MIILFVLQPALDTFIKMKFLNKSPKHTKVAQQFLIG